MVQIKHYINSERQIDVDEIRKLNSAKRNHDCLLARFITSWNYSNPALVEADKFKIKTHGIDWINSKVIPWKDEQVIKIYNERK